MNKWNIPHWLENEIRNRDKNCIYCRQAFTNNTISKKRSATWEHIVNDVKIISRENIALCCASCNASKGAKKLADWIRSEYCINKNITKKNVAIVVKKALEISK